jgi:hypothetical protein
LGVFDDINDAAQMYHTHCAVHHTEKRPIVHTATVDDKDGDQNFHYRQFKGSLDKTFCSVYDEANELGISLNEYGISQCKQARKLSPLNFSQQNPCYPIATKQSVKKVKPNRWRISQQLKNIAARMKEASATYELTFKTN